MLELRNVGKRYPTGGDDVLPVLEGVSLSVNAGQFIALYGPSGSGKTTLLNLIGGLLSPDTGSVLVNDRDLATLSSGELSTYRKHYLGYIAQSLELIPGVSALDNASLRLLGTCSTRVAQRKVTPILERLGLGNHLDHHPDELSAGQRQRVLIARALATNPKLILADEPTGNLDSKRSDEVLALLTELLHERDAALLLVTHDPAAASFATAIYQLREGRLSPYKPATSSSHVRG